MVSMSASVNLPLHHKVQKFSSGTSSPGWSRKKGRKMVVVGDDFYVMCTIYLNKHHFNITLNLVPLQALVLVLISLLVLSNTFALVLVLKSLDVILVSSIWSYFHHWQYLMISLVSYTKTLNITISTCLTHTHTFWVLECEGFLDILDLAWRVRTRCT